MKLRALWEIKGEISLDRYYEEVLTGWRPPHRSEHQISVKNNKNFVSNYERKMFVNIREERLSKIDEILNSNPE
jgi:hypothetical protein